MEARYILAIDQGTTGSTVLILDASDLSSFRIVGRSTVDFPQHFPKPGWVEHDLAEIWSSIKNAAAQAIAMAEQQANLRTNQIVAIGITNQRETLCTFDRNTGQAIAPAIVWQCRRSADVCGTMKERGLESSIKEKTGLVLDPYFSGSKMSWLMDHHPEAATQLRNGKAVMGTIDTFVLHRLTNGETFATEASNASRTLLMDLKSAQFDAELMELFKVPSASALAEIKPSAGIFGHTKGLDFLPDGIPISGILGDQQAALAGQTCYGRGEAKCTYGTGAFLLANIGNTILHSKAGLLTTVAWDLGGKLTYAFEGSAFIAGAAIQFLRDQMGFLKDAKDSEQISDSVRGAPEIYFVPALAGLGAPHWDPHARGAFFGITRGTQSAQMVRAALEGIAFQVHDLTKAIAQDFPEAVSVLRVDGGAAANNLLMQTQADLLGLPVDRPENLETTAFGAALFAGLGVGMFSSLDELRNVRSSERLFQPETSEEALERRHSQLAGWSRAVESVRLFAGEHD